MFFLCHFDKNISGDKLEEKARCPSRFIHDRSTKLSAELESIGSSLLVKYGDQRQFSNHFLAI